MEKRALPKPENSFIEEFLKSSEIGFKIPSRGATQKNILMLIGSLSLPILSLYGIFLSITEFSLFLTIFSSIFLVALFILGVVLTAYSLFQIFGAVYIIFNRESFNVITSFFKKDFVRQKDSNKINNIVIKRFIGKKDEVISQAIAVEFSDGTRETFGYNISIPEREWITSNLLKFWHEKVKINSLEGEEIGQEL